MTALRDALHTLAPEPPDDLGLATTARRRARSLRRRRTLAATGTALAVVAGAAFAGGALPRDRAVAPVTHGSELTGTFPNWPRRGDGDPLRDRAAIDAWAMSVKHRDGAVVGTPRVLYAGGDRVPVVVLHGTAYPGGDRIAVVTFEAGAAGRVIAEGPAPLPGVAGLVVTFDPAREGGVEVGGDMCRKGPADDPAHDTRDLLIVAPDVRRAQWRSDGFPPTACGPGSPLVTDWRDVPVDGGAVLVPVPMGPFSMIRWSLTRADGATGVPHGPGSAVASLWPVMLGSGGTPLGWARRQDGSRAAEAGVAVCRWVEGGSPPCVGEWAVSLPDGTSAGLHAVVRDPGRAEPWLFADDARGVFRAYRLPSGVVGAVAGVVEGRGGRWLLVVGPPSMSRAAVHAGGAPREVELRHGTGFLRLADGEDLAGATVVTSEGTYPVERPEGQVVP